MRCTRFSLARVLTAAGPRFSLALAHQNTTTAAGHHTPNQLPTNQPTIHQPPTTATHHYHRNNRAVYNAVPPLLFFTFVLGSQKTVRLTAFWTQAVSLAAGAGAVVALW